MKFCAYRQELFSLRFNLLFRPNLSHCRYDPHCKNQLLTYMSRCPEIDALAIAELHCLESLTTGDDTVRVLYVTKAIWDVINPPYAASKEGEMHAEFRQSLDAFLEGCEFSVAQNPFPGAWRILVPRHFCRTNLGLSRKLRQ